MLFTPADDLGSYSALHHHLLQLFADVREGRPLVWLLLPAAQHQIVPEEQSQDKGQGSVVRALHKHLYLILTDLPSGVTLQVLKPSETSKVNVSFNDLFKLK